MLEQEYNELNQYTIKASEAVADYYDRFDSLTAKDKKYVIDKILSLLDIVLIFTMNIRHQLIVKLNNASASLRIQLNQHLVELKTTADTAKTLSFNFTTILNSTRDDLKCDNL